MSDNAGFNFRLDWRPDTLTQIFFTPDFGYSKSHSSEIKNTSTRLNSDTLNTSNSDVFSDGAGYNLSGRLEFSRKLNSEGRVLSFSLSGGLNDSYTDEVK